MTVTAMILVIISACMHASWNLFSKRQSPTIGFFQLATLGTVVWFSPIFIITTDLVAEITFSLWTILLVAGFFQAIYYTGLASAYARGALSIAYPLARSFPLLILMALTLITGRGSDLSTLAVIGFIAIVTGALLLPMNSFADFRLVNYFNSSSAFAILAAIGTAGYSFVDDIGMNQLKLVPNEAEGWVRAMLYLVLECIFTAFWLQILMQFTKKSTAHFLSSWRSLLKPALLAGFAIGATYGIILLAMTHSKNVSYVVGLRQLSIPIGTIMGVLILKEKGSAPRFFGVGVLFIGLVLVAIG
ncbi:multidrug DMT transporter permease [Desulforhopalus sp. IMCC35007]|uniref:multidrug DMT transporter permease n=1 Tax=Desulforhopalus sp. IMCC35007 TaxID=2569543 RepID=UPI0010AEE104|nr:multidrug DMT transporter permease [Desulforhopalus sp. IMCC35007]TKB07782.1 multidrug DMT transporter permease [Desulforhopalus sp. IMCC35007]